MAMIATTEPCAPLMLAEPACLMSVTETWWGYVIRSERIVSSARRLLMVVAGFFAASFAIASAVLWVAPASAFPGEVVLMKGAASSLTAMIALLCARLATEDAVIEIQVDLRRGELREVSRRAGERARLLGRYGFDDIGGVFFDGSDPHRLVARCGDGAELIVIAEGCGPAPQRLRDRIGRDVTRPVLAA